MPLNPRTVMQTFIALALVAGIAWFQQPQEQSGSTQAASLRPAPAQDPVAASFDFFVLALSWSPTHCASEDGRGQDDDLQCRSGRPYGFVLHGLWPQNERGWPEFCSSDGPRTVRGAVLADALAIMPSAKLVQHQWRKHGTCSGLALDRYFATAARAVAGIKVPDALKSPERPLTKSADEVRGAFLDANPGLERAGLVVTCRRNALGEVRVCLDTQLRPRACSAEVSAAHCGGRRLRLMNVRGYWPRD